MTEHFCMRTLAEFVKRIRETHGWSQEDLAADLGMSREYVSHVEKSRIKDALSFARKLYKHPQMTAHERAELIQIVMEGDE